jgi:hypothetical protein
MSKPLITLTAVAAAALAAGCEVPEPDCDRECLIGLADTYLAALASNEPAAVPLADDIAFVENIMPLTPGQGLWASAAGQATAFRIDVPDPTTGAIGLMTVIGRRGEGGIVPALVAIRLLHENGEITEAEHLVADLPEEADPARLLAPRRNLVTAVPETGRIPRDDIAAIAASYYEALDRSDAGLAPFADDCERQENGMITAGPDLPPAVFDSVDVDGRSPPPVARDCIGQVNSRRFAYIDSIDNRRVFAVDPVRGLAMGLSHFRQSMSRGPHRMVAADGSERMWDEAREAYDLPAAHIFRITDGEIHEVEAIGIFVPYDSPTGWE